MAPNERIVILTILMTDADPHASENHLDLVELRERLPAHDVRFYTLLPSTNDEAKRLARENDIVPPGLIITPRQTRGRGRRGNRWWSSTGALTCSFVISTPSRQPSPPQVGLTENLTGFAAALATREAVAHFVPTPVQLKWPNDILLQQKKVAGILCETSHETTVIGIGVNVNNAIDIGPPELPAHAVAICQILNNPIRLVDLTVRIAQQLANWLTRVRPDTPWADEFNRHHALQDKMVRIDAGGQCQVGLCRGVDNQGRLLQIQAGDQPTPITAGHVLDWT